MLSITHVFRVARNLCGMNGHLGLRTLPEQDCVFEELRGTQNMCPAWSDVRQRGVSASGAVLRMHDYRTHTQGRVGLGLGDRDDWKGPQRCASRQVSVAIRSGKRERKQEVTPRGCLVQDHRLLECQPGNLCFLVQAMGNHGREP